MANSKPTMRSESRREFCVSGTNGNVTRGDIDTGCLQRIADATEKMAASYADLDRRIAALKGAITRMRRKAEGDQK